MNPELTILMPAYNERGTIEEAIADALGADLPVAGRQLVIIDDGSTEWLGAGGVGAYGATGACAPPNEPFLQTAPPCSPRRWYQ